MWLLRISLHIFLRTFKKSKVLTAQENQQLEYLPPKVQKQTHNKIQVDIKTDRQADRKKRKTDRQAGSRSKKMARMQSKNAMNFV